MAYKKMAALLATGMLFMGITACEKAPPEETPKVEKLTLTAETTELEMFIGDTIPLVITAQADNKQLPSPAIEWSSSDPYVATAEAGTVTAHKPGKTTITASLHHGGKDASATVGITVTKPTRTMEMEEPILIDLSREDGGLVSFTFPVDDADVDNVFLGTEEFRIVQQGENVLINSTHLNPGEYIMTVEKETEFISFPVCVATMVIRSADDLEKATLMPGADKGYFVLGCNIDCAELEEPVCFTDQAIFETNLGQNRAGFLGGFNGMGYTISNLKVPQYGLFGCIAASGVVRNVAFTHIQAEENAICKDNAGVISQLYVEGDFSRVLFASYAPSNKLENIVAQSTKPGAMICQHIATVDTSGYSVSEVRALLMIGPEAMISGWSRTKEFSNLVADETLRVCAADTKENIPAVSAEDGFNRYWDITSGYPVFISSEQ